MLLTDLKKVLLVLKWYCRAICYLSLPSDEICCVVILTSATMSFTQRIMLSASNLDPVLPWSLNLINIIYCFRLMNKSA
jgi:hypothetical protein